MQHPPPPLGSSPALGAASAPVPSPPPAPTGSTTAVLSPPPAPTDAPLSDYERVRLACDKINASIFHVKFEFRSDKVVQTHIENLIRKLPAADQGKWKDMMDEVLKTVSETTTGFLVGESPTSLFILTCAHSFQVCFSGSSPMSMTTLKKLFKIKVLCDHKELSHNQNQKVPREYEDAEVFKVDSRKDMLLLKVKKGFCHETHPVLEISENLPDGSLGLVRMVSWPFDRHRTTVQGHMSHNHRIQQHFNDPNRHGYNFSAIEVNITSDGGSSGAPLVDLRSRVLGMLHGGNIDCVTYFVAMDVISKNLTSWGIIKKVGVGTSSSGQTSGSGSSSLKRSAGAP